MAVDSTASGDLPTPAQIRAFQDVTRAAWQARRMLEASRAFITGNLAFGICLLGTFLVVVHSTRVGPAGLIVMAVLAWGYLISLFFAIRRRKRRRATSLVTVLDRREAEARKAPASPRRVAAVLFLAFGFQAICGLAWGFAFRHMSNSAILASLALGPVIGIGFFVHRYVLFQFWEDLLFAGCVALAFAPMFLRSWDLTPLSFLALALVVAGGCSLDHRWSTWTRSLADREVEDAFEEVRS